MKERKISKLRDPSTYHTAPSINKRGGGSSRTHATLFEVAGSARDGGMLIR